MMSDRAGPEQAEEVAAYAAARGATLRTAQRHRKAGHPDWLRFLREGNVPAKVAVAVAAEAPAWGLLDTVDADPVVQAALAAYNLAVAGGDNARASSCFDRVLKAREQARKDRLSDPRIALSSGAAVPKATVLRYVQRAHQMVADSIQEALVRLGRILAPEMPLVLVRERAREEQLRLLGDLSDEQRILAAITAGDE